MSDAAAEAGGAESASPSCSARVEVTRELVDGVLAVLVDTHKPVAERNRAIFTLRNLGGPLAADAFKRALDTQQGALLRHEIAFAMGQMQEVTAIPVLVGLLEDAAEDSMVRHEAAEALGAIGEESSLDVLARYQDDPCQEVAETCQLALDRIRWYAEKRRQQIEVRSESLFYSVDPAPPASTSTPISELRATLLDESARMFDRYSAMFALRDIGSLEAAEALAAAFNCSSSLLKHEIAYVLGQLQHKASLEPLCAVLRDTREHCMVRHEAAEALGTVADEDAVALLKKHLEQAGEDPVVRESCAVALDVAEYYTSSSFEYADGVAKVQAAATS